MQNTQKNFYKKLLGGIGEKKAEKYLKKNKYVILAKNYTTHFGEIDIIAKSKEEEIVFIEVKTRKDDYFGRPSEAVNKIKQSALSVIEQPNVSLEAFEKANGSKKILIIGNSVIGTSQVGAFLSNMLTGSGYSVEAISRGHATVKTYAEDSALMSRIKNGEFAYVFQCGFYATENAAALETVKNSCAASDTNLVIFPAHNESEGTINAAKLQYTDAYFIDWRSEITTLINGGVDRWDMCKDDQYKHSTPLAGYVGAHMIYSNLFKKVPPAITGGAPLTMDEIKAKLGDYPERSVSLIHQSTQIVEFTGTEYKIA